MKNVIIALLFITIQCAAQDKVRYIAPTIDIVLLTTEGKVLAHEPYGRNVTLQLDKYFKSWVIKYDDELSRRRQIGLRYLGDYSKDGLGWKMRSTRDELFFVYVGEDKSSLVLQGVDPVDGAMYLLSIQGLRELK